MKDKCLLVKNIFRNPSCDLKSKSSNKPEPNIIEEEVKNHLISNGHYENDIFSKFRRTLTLLDHKYNHEACSKLDERRLSSPIDKNSENKKRPVILKRTLSDIQGSSSFSYKASKLMQDQVVQTKKPEIDELPLEELLTNANLETEEKFKKISRLIRILRYASYQGQGLYYDSEMLVYESLIEMLSENFEKIYGNDPESTLKMSINGLLLQCITILTNQTPEGSIYENLVPLTKLTCDLVSMINSKELPGQQPIIIVKNLIGKLKPISFVDQVFKLLMYPSSSTTIGTTNQIASYIKSILIGYILGISESYEKNIKSLLLIHLTHLMVLLRRNELTIRNAAFECVYLIHTKYPFIYENEEIRDSQNPLVCVYHSRLRPSIYSLYRKLIPANWSIEEKLKVLDGIAKRLSIRQLARISQENGFLCEFGTRYSQGDKGDFELVPAPEINSRSSRRDVMVRSKQRDYGRNLSNLRESRSQGKHGRVSSNTSFGNRSAIYQEIIGDWKSATDDNWRNLIKSSETLERLIDSANDEASNQALVQVFSSIIDGLCIAIKSHRSQLSKSTLLLMTKLGTHFRGKISKMSELSIHRLLDALFRKITSDSSTIFLRCEAEKATNSLVNGVLKPERMLYILVNMYKSKNYEALYTRKFMCKTIADIYFKTMDNVDQETALRVHEKILPFLSVTQNDSNSDIRSHSKRMLKNFKEHHADYKLITMRSMPSGQVIAFLNQIDIV